VEDWSLEVGTGSLCGLLPRQDYPISLHMEQEIRSRTPRLPVRCSSWIQPHQPCRWPLGWKTGQSTHLLTQTQEEDVIRMVQEHKASRATSSTPEFRNTVLVCDTGQPDNLPLSDSGRLHDHMSAEHLSCFIFPLKSHPKAFSPMQADFIWLGADGVCSLSV
jgi:hypothetical protein